MSDQPGSWRLVVVNGDQIHVCGQGSEKLHCGSQPIYTQRTVWPREIEGQDLEWCEECHKAYFDRKAAFAESAKPRRKG